MSDPLDRAEAFAAVMNIPKPLVTAIFLAAIYDGVYGPLVGYGIDLSPTRVAANQGANGKHERRKELMAQISNIEDP